MKRGNREGCEGGTDRARTSSGRQCDAAVPRNPLPSLPHPWLLSQIVAAGYDIVAQSLEAAFRKVN